MAPGNTTELEKLKLNVQTKFDRIREALNVREKLLLRQIDAISSSQLHKNTTAPASPGATHDEMQFLSENEEELLTTIRTFGKFNLDKINLALQDLFMNEDYIAPAIDHEIMYKCLDTATFSDEENANDGNAEKVTVDFSGNRKLFKENVTNINESIINITLKEAKELIQNSKKVDAGSEKVSLTIKSQSSQTDVRDQSRAANYKPKITINNCNGTINLKNISNLTINCTNEDTFKVPAQIVEGQSMSTPYSPSDEVGSASDASHTTTGTNPASSTKEEIENSSVNCEFYNRLLDEIKKSLRQKSTKGSAGISASKCNNDQQPAEVDYENKSSSPMTENTSNSSGSGSRSHNSTSVDRKLVLKNFENLKIVLESTDGSEPHPVQIEQWLAEIISETEVEPMQNTEILEHSRLHKQKKACSSTQ